MTSSIHKRKLRRFFFPGIITQPGQAITLPPEETVHMKTVLRLEPGGRCLVVDSQGQEAEAVITRYLSAGSALQISELKTEKAQFSEAPAPFKFYVSLPQRGKFDLIVEKAQELEVPELIPIMTQRTVVRLGEKKDKVLERWKKIGREAAKQSGAHRLTRVQPSLDLNQALQSIPKSDQIIFFHPSIDAELLSVWAKKAFVAPKAEKISHHFFIGPEGGFSDSEIEKARAKGAVMLSLGEVLLKVDTAFLAAAIYVKFSLQAHP